MNSEKATILVEWWMISQESGWYIICRCGGSGGAVFHMFDDVQTRIKTDKKYKGGEKFYRKSKCPDRR